MHDDTADAIRRDLTDAVRWSATYAGRSAQPDPGPSEIGHPCDRRIAYQLLDMPPANHSDPLPAFLGTGGHTALGTVFASTYQGQDPKAWARWRADPTDEAAFRAAQLAPYRDHPRYDVETHLTIPGLPRGGTCDLYDRYRRAVIDHKWPGAWAYHRARTHGPDPTHRIQVHVYAYGWEHTTGHPPDHVAIAYWPREKSAKYSVKMNLDYVFVWSEPYDRTIAENAIARLDHLRHATTGMDAETFPDLLHSFPTTPHACQICPWHNPHATHPGQGCPGI